MCECVRVSECVLFFRRLTVTHARAAQELLARDIPSVERDGVRAKVIAGKALGIESPVYTRTPVYYLDFQLQPGAVLEQAVPAGA